MKPIWIIPAASLILGLAVGYGLRKSTASPALRNTATAAADSGARQSARPTTSRPSGPPASDSVAACQDRGRTERIQALARLYGTLDADGFATEVKRLLDVPIDERFVGLFMLYGRWAETDPQAAIAHINTMDSFYVAFMPVLLQSWANTDPAAAAAFYQEKPEQFKRLLEAGGGDAAAHIAGEWARHDPEAALAWSQSLSGVAKDAALGGVLREYAEVDPAKAWELASGLSAEQQAKSLAEIATTWGRNHYDGIEQRIASQSAMPDETKATLRAAALIGLSGESPSAAAGKLASFPPGPQRDDAIRPIITENLAKKDAASAAHWASEHSSDYSRSDDLARIMPEYVRQDAKGAREFANTFPAGRDRDWVVLRYAMDAIKQGKETSQQIAPLTDTIVDPEIKGWARSWLPH